MPRKHRNATTMSQPIQLALQHSPAVYKLPNEIMEEVVCYLPVSCYGSLALVSKSFSPRFQYRHISTGTALAPLQSFEAVRNEPRLATFIREVTIHESFFGPKIEDQWFLQGEPEHVRVAAEKEAWILKAELLGNVLENATHSRHLTVLGFPIGFSGGITRLITGMCQASINTLDVVADARFFDAMESLRGNMDSVRNLTLRHGEGPDLGTLVDPAVNPDADADADADTDSDADADVEPEIDTTVLYSRMLHMLKKFPRLRSIRFYKAKVDHTAPVLFKEIKANSPDLCEVVFDACIGLSSVLSILHAVNGIERCLVFRPSGPLGFDDMPNQLPGVFEGLKTCILETGSSSHYMGNLVQAILLCTPYMRSFGFCYTDLPYESPSSWTLLPDPIIQSLSAMRLRSLSLFGPRKMGIDQLEIICDSIPSLVQFTVLVEGSAQDISKYSQFFSKLEHLLVLQVLVTWEKGKNVCPCGHEEGPSWVSHRAEGTGMGRLIRRFTPEHGPAVVRLQRKGWTDLTIVMSPVYPAIGREPDEIRWIEHPADPSSNRDLALKKLEDVVGLFKNRAEAESKVFSASFWV